MPQELQFCRVCGGRWLPSELSNRGICYPCGKKLMMEAISQMEAKAGPIYEKWRKNYIAAMSGVINRLRKEIEQDELPF